jgi:hypothetical protein
MHVLVLNRRGLYFAIQSVAGENNAIFAHCGMRKDNNSVHFLKAYVFS